MGFFRSLSIQRPKTYLVFIGFGGMAIIITAFEFLFFSVGGREFANHFRIVTVLCGVAWWFQCYIKVRPYIDLL